MKKSTILAAILFVLFLFQEATMSLDIMLSVVYKHNTLNLTLWGNSFSLSTVVLDGLCVALTVILAILYAVYTDWTTKNETTNAYSI